MFKQLPIFILAAMSIWLTACDDYDSFTTDRSATLRFSVEKVEFDTLITTVPSSTKTLVIYNRGDKGVRINEVRLAAGATSPFRVNIDGQDMSRTADRCVTDFEVRRRDSVIVRIEATLPDTDSDDPHLVTDDLVLTLESGVVQRVPISVVGRDAYFLQKRTLTGNHTFTAQRPYVVYDTLKVAKGATLTLQAGAQLLFHEGAGLYVQGTLKATGTLAQPVTLRGDRTDHMFDYLPYDRLPGRWEGVTIAPESRNNSLEYIDLHGANFGIRCEANTASGRKMKLSNSRIHNINGDGLDATLCYIDAVNTEISNTCGHCVNLLGGDVQFIHCTLAQFYYFDSDRGEAVNISCMKDDAFYELLRADFINCVISGYGDDVVLVPALDNTKSSGHDLHQTDDPQVNYLFYNCFMTTVIPEEEIYAPCFQHITLDPTDRPSESNEHNFRLTDTHNLLYDFTPTATSLIRGCADVEYAADYPTDRLGRSRTADNAPDAGCYEYVP